MSRTLDEPDIGEEPDIQKSRTLRVETDIEDEPEIGEELKPIGKNAVSK